MGDENVFLAPFLSIFLIPTIFFKKISVDMTNFQKINKNTYRNTFDLIPFLCDKRIAIFFISFFFLI